MATLYATEGLLVSPVGPIVRGREALMAHYTKRFASGTKAAPLQLRLLLRLFAVLGFSLANPTKQLQVLFWQGGKNDSAPGAVVWLTGNDPVLRVGNRIGCSVSNLIQSEWLRPDSRL